MFLLTIHNRVDDAREDNEVMISWITLLRSDPFQLYGTTVPLDELKGYSSVSSCKEYVY